MVPQTKVKVDMALTSDDILNQKFAITKFRDGYDMDQVDDFLDKVGDDLRAIEQEREELLARIEELTQQVEELQAAAQAQPVSAVPAQPEQPATTEAVPGQAGASADAVKSSAMLQLALELHDKYVSEGENTRNELVSEGEKKARELVSEAEKQRSDVLDDLNSKRLDLQNRINELRDFENEYRGTLRSYIEAQLRNLDGSTEPGEQANTLS